MDDLADALAGSFAVSAAPNCIAAPHPRFSQYKAKRTSSNQEERRRKYLELQKQKRFDATSFVRCLTEDVWDEADLDDSEESDDVDAMDVNKIQLKKPGRHYRNQLMLSEWMLEVPENFVNDWLMVPCPVGKRCLVIASSGNTKSYARNGFRINTFPSVLPGGSRNRGRSGHTVLDCIYCDAKRTYYVLDLMCWGHPAYDCETEFRFYWMQSKFQETPEASEISRLNPFRFEVLSSFPCSLQTIEQALVTAATFELDGLLFYHKKAHYTFGASPLVVWLKAYMVPEILGIEIPSELAALAPSSYAGFGSHADAVRKRQQERSKKSTANGNREIADSVNESMESEVAISCPDESVNVNTCSTAENSQ